MQIFQQQIISKYCNNVDKSTFQHDEDLLDTVMHGIHARPFRQTFRDQPNFVNIILQIS